MVCARRFILAGAPPARCALLCSRCMSSRPAPRQHGLAMRGMSTSQLPFMVPGSKTPARSRMRPWAEEWSDCQSVPRQSLRTNFVAQHADAALVGALPPVVPSLEAGGSPSDIVDASFASEVVLSRKRGGLDRSHAGCSCLLVDCGAGLPHIRVGAPVALWQRWRQAVWRCWARYACEGPL